MKNLIAILLFTSVGQAHAEKTCYGRNEHCSAKRNLICAHVEKIDGAIYRLSNLQHVTGCMVWGVSKIKSKNKICKNILAKFGEKRKVDYLSHSDIRGEMETAFDHESIGQIDCEIKD